MNSATTSLTRSGVGPTGTVGLRDVHESVRFHGRVDTMFSELRGWGKMGWPGACVPPVKPPLGDFDDHEIGQGHAAKDEVELCRRLDEAEVGAQRCKWQQGTERRDAQ